MFKSLVAKFMAKTLITKIIIITSSAVVIGGVTAGAIIIPKQIEIKKEEQRQEQIRLENEKDLSNMSLTIKEGYEEKGITMPLNGVTNGITIERYDNFEKYLLNKDGSNPDYGKKEELHKELINFFVESYTGGELTVEENIDLGKIGEYPIVFTLTSEKGNTKTATVPVTVCNYFKVSVNVDKTDITITKGTEVDIMKGVSFDSNLPKEEQGHIETSGTVDVNTVGTYTITYTYVAQEGKNEEAISEATRTYKVIDPLRIQQNVEYELQSKYNTVGLLRFEGNTFTMSEGEGQSGCMTIIGTYTENNGNITLKANSMGDEGFSGDCNDIYTGKISNAGKTITITFENGDTQIYKLK